MNNLTTTAYFALLSSFLKAIGQSEAIDSMNTEEGVVEWEVGNLIVRLIPYRLGEEAISENRSVSFNEPEACIIEADLMLLDLENRKVNHDRFLILHQLNAVSRLTTGIVAFISDSGMLFINKIVPLENLHEDQLARHLAQVIQAAEDLYEGWNQLGNDLDPRNILSANAEEIKSPGPTFA